MCEWEEKRETGIVSSELIRGRMKASGSIGDELSELRRCRETSYERGVIERGRDDAVVETSAEVLRN